MHVFKWKDFSVDGGVLHFYVCGFFAFWQYEKISLSLFISKYFPQKESLKKKFQHKKKLFLYMNIHISHSYAAVCQLIFEHHKNIP